MEVSMYTNLLVPTDGSKLSVKAVVHALGLAKALQAKIAVLYATPPFAPESLFDGGGALQARMPKSEYEAIAARAAERVLKPLADKAAAAKVACTTSHVFADAPWEAIIAEAGKQKCDAIVMASHGRRGVSALLLGSETQKVLTHSKVPVVVVR
jgi:nucleotide-binding universal stress UspA family protein